MMEIIRMKKYWHAPEQDDTGWGISILFATTCTVTMTEYIVQDQGSKLIAV